LCIKFSVFLRMKKIIQFFKEAKVELSKVIWPTRKQAIYLTGIVIAFSLLVSLFVAGWDLIFTKLIELLSNIVR
jgi:preprotein translocase subunit SecE